MILVVDNFTSIENQDKILSIFTNWNNFPWYWFPRSTYFDFDIPDKLKVDGSFDFPQLSHTIFHNGQPNSSCFSYLNDNLFCNFNNIELVRVKVNMTVPLANYPIDCIGSPHVDFTNKNADYTCVYYVNDSDGETVIFNQKYTDDFNNLTVKHKVKPKKGRIVIFDSEYLHASTMPKHSERIVLNINYKSPKGCGVNTDSACL